MITKTLRRWPSAAVRGLAAPVAGAVTPPVAGAVTELATDEELQPTASGHPAKTMAASHAR
jgi:hypothetical protein